MQFLPPLTTQGDENRLPLSDYAAARLIAALLGGARSRIDECVAAIANDPALAVWAICRASQRTRHNLRTVPALATWLAEEALPELHWPADGANCSQNNEQIKGWATLAGRSVARAELAEQRAKQSQACPETAYLLGLLSDAPAWFAIAGAAVDHTGDAFPGWLREEIEQATQDAKLCEHAEYQARAEAASGRWLAASRAGEQLQTLTNKLARLRQLEDKFQSTLEHEKLESLKELAYGAGHEINNPLANISARAQTLLREERDPERRRKLAAINTQAFRAHEMISDMMLFARPPRPKLERIDLVELLTAEFDAMSSAAVAQNTELAFHPPAHVIMARVDKTQIAVAVRAICTNALEALVTGGKVDLTITEHNGAGRNGTERHGDSTLHPEPDESTKLAPCVQITVADNGPGISEETRRHLFDPFYSGREAGRGLGFGLTKSWRIITMHGGQIDIESRLGSGSTFTIFLPIEPAS